jgi:tetratricopeptide (TPR) repeat protein
MRVLVWRRRPEVLFLASLLVLAITIAARALWPQSAASPGVDPAPLPAAELGDERTIAALQERIRQNPSDTGAYAMLGLGLLQRVRETADPGLYTRAGQALDEALKRDPANGDALLGQGVLALARHQFADALAWGERARDANQFRAQPYGVIADALTELGRYDEAADAADKMVALRPDLASYSRVAYGRELRGDTAGAISAMAMAVSAGGGAASEATLWTQVQLGNLYFNSGDLARAEQTYAQALSVRPDYVYAAAGAARVLAARGRTADAITIYEKALERLPLPEFAIALGELYEAQGRSAEAEQQYALVRAMQQLNAGAGMNVDMELALFDADHGADPAATVQRARAAFAARPGIYGADALAWALYRQGSLDEAWETSRQALVLGTRDANLLFRAGMIAHARHDFEAAKRLLAEALAINPHFSPLRAPAAQATLAAINLQ